MFSEGGSVQQITSVDLEKVHNVCDGRGSHSHEKSVEVRLVLIGSQEEKLPDSMIFPFGQKLVQRPVKGLSLDSGGAGVTLLSWIPDSVIDAGSQEDLALSGDFLGDSLHNESVRSEWEVGPMLDQRPDGKNQARIPGEDSADFRPGEALEAP